jgi:hypothetical protein
MSLHARIMNIAERDRGLQDHPDLCYGLGHRDARHAAAEIAAEGDALVEELVNALARLCRNFPTDSDMLDAEWSRSQIAEACDAYDAASAALAKARP